MLKDEKLLSSSEKEVKNLRNFLMQLSKHYDGIEKIDHYMEFLFFATLVPKDYMELPESRMTENTKFIEELLVKYGLTKLSVDVNKELKVFEETIETIK